MGYRELFENIDGTLIPGTGITVIGYSSSTTYSERYCDGNYSSGPVYGDKTIPCSHYAIFDLGASRYLSKIKIYGDSPTSVRLGYGPVGVSGSIYNSPSGLVAEPNSSYYETLEGPSNTFYINPITLVRYVGLKTSSVLNQAIHEVEFYEATSSGVISASSGILRYNDESYGEKFSDSNTHPISYARRLFWKDSDSPRMSILNSSNYVDITFGGEKTIGKFGLSHTMGVDFYGSGIGDSGITKLASTINNSGVHTQETLALSSPSGCKLLRLIPTSGYYGSLSISDLNIYEYVTDIFSDSSYRIGVKKSLAKDVGIYRIIANRPSGTLVTSVNYYICIGPRSYNGVCNPKYKIISKYSNQSDLSYRIISFRLPICNAPYSIKSNKLVNTNCNYRIKAYSRPSVDSAYRIVAMCSSSTNSKYFIKARYNTFGISTYVITPESGTFVPGSGITISFSGSCSGGVPGSYYKWEMVHYDGNPRYSVSGIDMNYFTHTHYYSGYGTYQPLLRVTNFATTDDDSKHFHIYTYPGVAPSMSAISGVTPFNVNIYSHAISGVTDSQGTYSLVYNYGDGTIETTGALSRSHWYVRSSGYAPSITLTDTLGTVVSGSCVVTAYKPSRDVQTVQADRVMDYLYIMLEDILEMRDELEANYVELSGLRFAYGEDFLRAYPSGSAAESGLSSDLVIFPACVDYIDVTNPSG